MLLFWIAAALLAAAAAALVMWRARGSDAAPAQSPELAVYRRHLAEQDELKARGLLGETEWKASRTFYVIVDPLNVALPVPQLSGVPFAYGQYRTTIGVEIDP